jgi:dolichyl-phosphate-mannose-protein mannosyltransferase
VGRRGAALFGAAVVVAVLVTFAVRDSRGYAVLADDGHEEGDIVSYVDWTRLVTLGGIQAAYSGTWPETYAVYPPVTLYGFQLLGNLYRGLVDPSFARDAAQAGRWLPRALKAEAVAWQLSTALAIYLLARRRPDAWLAGVAAALYAVNPAVLFDAAHWAQPDGAHSLFSVLAVGWLELGLPLLGWAALALAALAKPQAWALVPLLVLATWRLGGSARLLQGVGVAAVVGLVVVLPFVATGHLAELLTLPGTIATVMPVATADAHNLWWLVLGARGQDPLATADVARLVGPLTYRAAAAILVLGQLVFTGWLFWSRRVGLAEAAALGTLGWFVFTTQAHENHLVLALPLLALAWPGRPPLLVPYAVLTTTVLLNMALHDQLLLQALGRDLADAQVVRLRELNAVANVACLVAWSVAAARRAPAPSPTPTSATPTVAAPPQPASSGAE